MGKRLKAFDAVRVRSVARSRTSFWRSACVAPLALAIGVTAISHGYGLNSSVSSTVEDQPASPMAEPGYLEAVSDPLFGTTFARITTPGRELVPGASCSLKYCRHRYSSAQAWNADQSLLVITA